MRPSVFRTYLNNVKAVSSLTVFASLFFYLVPASAYTPIIPQWWKDAHQYDPDKELYDYLTFTTAYFGPNALPVPELYDGRIPEKKQAELTTDTYWGFGDKTQSVSARFVYIPGSGRFSISGWGVLAEHYKTTIAVRDQRASIIENGEGTLLIGDLYISTLIGLFKEKKYCPDLNLEIVLKTSSSNSPYGARYFDTPGYWFDLTAGKSILFPRAFVKELRFVGVLGFLSYQLNTPGQNDAPLYGGKIILSSDKWSLENGIHGYSGWLEKGDKPQVLRSKLNFKSGNLLYFIQYQHALRDYPFRRIQTGVNLSF